MEISIKFNKTHEDAKKPKQTSPGANGYDLSNIEEVMIPACGRKMVSTGLSVEIPPGYYALINSRSGLALNHGLIAFNGLIDSDYRGEIKILLFNFGDKDIHLAKGTRCAQIIARQNISVNFVEVESLNETERGIKGFGSSGDH